MIERVLVAFDGSELAREAFAYAAMLAEPAGLEIFGVHVLEPDPPLMVAGDPALIDPTPIIEQNRRERDSQRRWAQREFAEMAALCAGRGVIFNSGVESGALLDSLVDIATARDLIAVGRKGRFSRSGIGSTTSALLHSAPCPVMVVSGPMRPINRVLAVSDGTSASKRAVAEADDLAAAAGWPLTILAAAGAQQDLAAALDAAQRLAPDAQVISLSEEEQSDEARLIEHAAGSDTYALLFMPAYAESWFHRLIFGSTTERVLSRLGSPVVLVH